MLRLPDSGFQPSVKEHNVELGVLVDWIEGSVSFIDDELSRSDVVDVLCENSIYRDQDFASELVADAWIELERRAESVVDGAPFKVDRRTIQRGYDWDTNTAYSFCLLLSLQSLYKGWAKQFGSDFTVQGDLFENLTVECLSMLGWTVHRTGWAPGNRSRIAQVVEEVSLHVCEPARVDEISSWIAESGHEEGLDVVCSDPFYDGWGGCPVYLFQCASGANWEDKLQTPDPKTWRQVISFTADPQRGFSMPFALLEQDFRRRAGKVNGMFLDRFRLQSPSADGDVNWISTWLVSSIVKWMDPRVKKLPDDRN